MDARSLNEGRPMNEEMSYNSKEGMEIYSDVFAIVCTIDPKDEFPTTLLEKYRGKRPVGFSLMGFCGTWFATHSTK